MVIERTLSTLRLHSVRQLSNDQLAAKLDRLNAQKRAVDAELLLCLSEIERRRLYREHACSSLFEFCVLRLSQSEDVAYKRVGAARLMLDYPAIYELLAKGHIHLTGLMLLKPHLTPAKHQDWLLAASGRSKRQIEKLIATRVPQPSVPPSVRKLPTRQPQPTALTSEPQHVTQTPTRQPRLDVAPPPSLDETCRTTPSTVSAAALPSDTATAGTTTASPTSVAAAARTTPLSSHTYRVVFTASERLKQKMDRARELLSHAIAPNDLPAILERALDQLIAREQQRRYGVRARTSNRTVPDEATAHEQPAPTCTDPGRLAQPGTLERDSHAACQKCPPSATELQDPDPNLCAKAKPHPRYVPATVRREVWARDGGQCTFVDRAGRRCDQRRFLELDHREAFSIGGKETVDNLRLRCHAHNALEAERLFGRRRIQHAIAHARSVRNTRGD